jgi:hypothetical protein
MSKTKYWLWIVWICTVLGITSIIALPIFIITLPIILILMIAAVIV